MKFWIFSLILSRTKTTASLYPPILLRIWKKIADYITFIHKGRIILSEEKDTLLERFVILKGPQEGFAAFESSELIGYKENRFGAEAMAEAKVWRKKEAGAAGLVADPVRIQDIMLYYVKGERI